MPTITRLTATVHTMCHHVYPIFKPPKHVFEGTVIECLEYLGELHRKMTSKKFKGKVNYNELTRVLRIDLPGNRFAEYHLSK